MIILTALLKIELASHTVRLCGGGTVPWDAETYSSEDELFGSIAGADGTDEGVGDMVPLATIRFLPPEGVAAADLIDPAHQGSRVRWWIGEIDATTGELAGEPDLKADMIIDVPRLRLGTGKRVLEVGVLSRWQLLKLGKRENTLSSAFHQSIFPGEKGFDNATGVTTSFAFGTISAPRGTTVVGGGGSRGDDWGVDRA